MKMRTLVVMFVIVAFLALSTGCSQQVPVAPIVVIPEKESQTPRPASTETPVPPTPTQTLTPTDIPTPTITPTATLTENQKLAQNFEDKRAEIEEYLKYTYDLFMGKFREYGVAVDFSHAVDEYGYRRKPEYYYTLKFQYTPTGSIDDFNRKVGSIDDEVLNNGRFPLTLWEEANWLRQCFAREILLWNGPTGTENLANYEIPLFETLGDKIYAPIDNSKVGRFIEEPHTITVGEKGTGFRFVTSGGVDFELLCEYEGDINFEITPIKCRVATKKGDTIVKEEVFATTSDALFIVGFCQGSDPNGCAVGGRSYYIGGLTAFSPAAGKFMALGAINREGPEIVDSLLEIVITLNGNWVWNLGNGYSQENWCHKDRGVGLPTNQYDLLNYFDYTLNGMVGNSWVFDYHPVTKPIWVTIDHTERCPVITPFEE